MTSKTIATIAHVGLLLIGAFDVCVARENAIVFVQGQWMAQPSDELSDLRNFQLTPEIKLEHTVNGWRKRKGRQDSSMPQKLMDNGG